MDSIRKRYVAERIALSIILLGFGYGVATHALDFVRFGWLPYRFGPPALNAFWNMLVALDAVVVALLLTGRRNYGLSAAAVVMIADVAGNSYAWLALNFDAFAYSVPVQAAFLGFVLGSAPFLWRHGGPDGPVAAHRVA